MAPKVKPHETEKVAFVTDVDQALSRTVSSPSPSDLSWARSGLAFSLGSSSWQERGNAIARAYGGKAEAAEAAGIPLGTFKSQLARGNPPKNPVEFAGQLGLSPGYVESGTPALQSDFDIEAIRLKLARGGFAPTGSTPSRRAAIRQVFEELRAEIDAARLGAVIVDAGAPPPPPRPFGMDDASDSIFAPPRLTTVLGLPGLDDGAVAPIGFSREWLARERLDPAKLGILELGRMFYLVDSSPGARQLVDRCTYVVHDSSGRFILCQWHRDNRVLKLAEGQSYEWDPYREPEAIVGRAVYALAAV